MSHEVFAAPQGGRRLGLFAKYMRRGQVKTRLTHQWDAATATRLQRRMLRVLLDRLTPVRADRQLWISPDSSQLSAARLAGPYWHVLGQGGGELGERLRRFLQPWRGAGKPLERPDQEPDQKDACAGPQAAIAIGADCPLLTAEELNHAFDCLEQPGVQCVIGPSFDGGYYLIGCRHWDPVAIMRDIPWGTDQVCAATEQRLQASGIRYERLPPRRDIDRPEDVQWLNHVMASAVREPSGDSNPSKPHAVRRLQTTVSRMSEVNCLIVGSGAIGLTLAYELARQGARVRVIDRGGHRQRSSWAGAGILPPTNLDTAVDPLEQLRAISHQRMAERAGQLREETGIDIEYRACGGLYLATSIAEAATLAAMAGYWHDQRIPVESWDGRRLIEEEPQLESLATSGRLRAAWFAPGEAQVRNPRLLAALAIACQQRGVILDAPCEVERLCLENDRVVGVFGGGQMWHADRVCLCGGAWTRELLAEHGVASELVPVRGQIQLYRFDRPPFQRVINEGHRYLVPRLDGHVLVGSNEEEVGYRIETTPEVLDELRCWAISVCPAFETQRPVEAWAGLRPGTVDGLPYLGPIQGLQNAFIAAGHFRAGLHLSWGTAQVMSELMLGQNPAVDIRTFRLGRGGAVPGRHERP